MALKHSDLIAEDMVASIPQGDSRPVFCDATALRSHYREGIPQTYADAQAAYFELIEALTPEIIRPHHWTSKVNRHASLVPQLLEFYPSGTVVTFRQMSKAQRDAASRLYVNTQLAISDAFARGVAAGCDLLTQLVRGEVTLDDYNAGRARKLEAEDGK